MTSIMLDIVLLLIIIWSFISGLIKGALVEIFSMIGIVIGVFIAARSYIFLIPLFDFLPSKTAAILAFIIIIIIGILIFYIIGKLLRKFLRFLYIGFVDRLFGLIFGFLKGSIIAAIIVLILSSFSISNKWVEKSKVSPFLIIELNTLKGLLPQDVKDMQHWKNPHKKQPGLSQGSSWEPVCQSLKATFPA